MEEGVEGLEEMFSQLRRFMAGEDSKRAAHDQALAERARHVSELAGKGAVSMGAAMLDDVAAMPAPGSVDPSAGWAKRDAFEDPMGSAEDGVGQEMLGGAIELMENLRLLFDGSCQACDLMWSPCRLLAIVSLREAALHALGAGPAPKALAPGWEAAGPWTVNEASCFRLAQEAAALGRGTESFHVGEGLAGPLAEVLNGALSRGGLARIQAEALAGMDLAPWARSSPRGGL